MKAFVLNDSLLSNGEKKLGVFKKRSLLFTVLAEANTNVQLSQERMQKIEKRGGEVTEKEKKRSGFHFICKGD